MRLAPLVLCLIITACSAIETQQSTTPPLPARFLGAWYYSRPYDIKIDIRKDGTILETAISDNKFRGLKEYKVAYIENPNSVYIIEHDTIYGKYISPSMSYVHLTTLHVTDLDAPNRFEWWFGCYPKNKKEEWNWTPEQYRRRLLYPRENECKIKDMYGAEYYYRDN